MMTYTAPLHSN